jgi:hypothetical protein
MKRKLDLPQFQRAMIRFCWLFWASVIIGVVAFTFLIIAIEYTKA